MLLRRLHSLLLALMLFAAGGAASAATTYTFGGGTIAGCLLTGTTYTCAILPLTGGDDNMVIASGFTVKITSNVSFGNNQSLTMSGTAVLASTGDLDISGMNGDNLQIGGGTLIAANTFSVGSQKQSLTANIQARDANLGNGSGLTITGNITVTGTVNIATNATINGSISGATVNAQSGSALYGDIVATNSFTLGSQGTVQGNITAPVVSLLPAQSVVTGNIKAKVSLELGSQVTVTGDVVAGTLTLDPSSSMVDGTATADSAVLGSKARVTQIIHCTGGSTPGRCDCVTNNSGYDVNTDYGPRCEGNTTTLDHFQIRYDPTGSVCAPSTVTITACANADCTSTYGGGAAVTLKPTGQAVAIPSSGSVQASVAWPQSGINTLGLSGATTVNPTTCWSNLDSGPGANCQVKVASAAYTLSLGTANGYTSDTPQTLTINALQQSSNGTCVPLFKNVTRNASFSCAYSNPATGTVPVRLNGVVLRAQATGTACDGGGPSMPVTFDANGKATLPLQYADAGKVTVTISDTGAGSPGTASVTPTFIPAKFQIALPSGPYVAGQDFYPKVTALNSNDNATPNFGKESPPQNAGLSPAPCRPNNNNGLLTSAVSATDGGVQTFKASWSEVGYIDVVASLPGGNYLGTLMAPATATTNAATSGCTGAAGPFGPAYFTFEVDSAWKRTAAIANVTRLQYYSGEPAIQLTVTARNAQNAVTQNYVGTYARDLVFTAIDPAGGALVGGGGTFSRSTGYPATDLTGAAQIRAADFGANGALPGTARWAGSYTFSASPTAPTLLRVRASEQTGQPNPASSSAIPLNITTGIEPSLLIRSGRVRIPSRFGSAGTLLKIPVSLQYFTGQTWVLNTDDSTTLMPPGAVSVGTSLGDIATGLGAFTNGATTLSLTPPAKSGRGSIPVAINLGTASINTSCYAARQAMTATPGAGLAFLRSVDPSCTAAGVVDPSALATFGVYAPENKRIIHMREVFR
jgi:MSHA biogenesis protein MshQ